MHYAPSMSTEIHLAPDEHWDYLSPEAIPPNVPTTGEGSEVIAPWLSEPVSTSLGAWLLSLMLLAAGTAETKELRAEQQALGHELCLRACGEFDIARAGLYGLC